MIFTIGKKRILRGIFEDKFLVDVPFSPECLGLGILRSDDIAQTIIIGDDQRGHFLVEHFIFLQYFEECIPFLGVFRLELMVSDRKIDEELVGVRPFPDDDMSEESLMSHLIMDGES